MKNKIEQFLSEQNIDIDLLNAYEEGMSFEDFEEEVRTLIYQEGFTYYTSAMDYLREHDISLQESLELAEDLGYSPSVLSSVVLATILKQEHIFQDWYEISGEIEELFNEMDVD